jgi:hypothetical protein
MIGYWIAWIWSWPREWFGNLGYAVRPYDMIADRRRWFRQPRTRCGFSYGYRIEEGTLTVANPDRPRRWRR